MKTFLKKFGAGVLAATLTAVAPATAADYKIDPTHSFVEFRIKHLGVSWLLGRFNDVSGSFYYDPAAGEDAQRIEVFVDPASIDSNHAERDKHLRGGDFLDVEFFDEASFVSNGFSGGENGGVMRGDLTFHGVTQEVAVMVEKVGEGPDPWGGYRAGFVGTIDLLRSDYDMDYNLGPQSDAMKLEVFIEGIRQ